MSALAGIGVVTEEVSEFDGARQVRLSPSFLYKKGSMMGVSTKLGAFWSSSAPDSVALMLSYSSNISSGSSYVGFNSIDINIDGVKATYTTEGSGKLSSSGYNSVSRTIYTKSENSITLPLSILEKMLGAKDCRLRINTSDGYEIAHFSIERIPGGQGTAILGLKEFVGKVKRS